MRRQVTALALAAGLFWGAHARAGKFESSALKGWEKAPDADKELTARPAEHLEGRLPIPSSDTEDEAKLKDAVDGFTTILKSQSAGPVRRNLLLGRASTYLALAQRRTLSLKAGSADPAVRDFLSKALADARELIRENPSDLPTLSEGYYVAGAASMYLGKNADAATYFRQSLEAGPDSKHAAWVSFYLAEDRYDAQKWKEAIELYRKHYSRWSPELKRLSLYRLAWCYIGLDRYDAAETLFLQLIQSSPQADISKDAVRDLSILLSRTRKDAELVRYADQKFARDPALRLQFLRAAFSNREARGAATLDSEIFLALLKVEPDPIERARMRIRSLANMSRGYASMNHYRAFQSLLSSFESDGPKPGSKEFGEIATVLDLEVQKLIKAFVETYTGRVKSPENITRPMMSSALEKLFAAYQRLFPDSQLKAPVYSLWLDVCSEERDWPCFDVLEARVLEDPKSGPLKVRASEERLVSLEERAKADPKKFGPVLREALAKYLEAYPDSKNWPRVARRLAELRLLDKNTGDALPLLGQLMAREPSQEAFYLLQWGRFLAGDYASILSDPRGSKLKGAPDPKLEGLVQDATLREALGSRDKGDFKAYEEKVQAFFKKEPWGSRRRLVERSYLEALSDKSDEEAVFRELLKAPRQERYSEELLPLARKSCFAELRSGAFKRALELFPAPVEEKDAAYCRALALLATGQKYEDGSLAPERKEYLLGLLALLSPKAATERFEKRPPESEAERTIASLAGRITSEKAAPESPLTDFEKRIGSVHLPKKGKGFEKALARAIRDEQRIYDSINGSLKGKTLEQQARIVRAAIALENGLAKAIQGSPQPKGLDADQKKEFLSELSKFADPYSHKAEELQALGDKIDFAIQDARARDKELYPARPSLARWQWPAAFASEPLSKAAALVKSRSYLAAMILSDLHRDAELKDDQEYYRARAGILLSSLPSEGMRRYVAEELRQAKQDGVIEEWKKAVGP